ncbi:MAG: hypothetical protein ACJASZ_002353 [Yoonia sp.]|jgi:hypothetical protein
MTSTRIPDIEAIEERAAIAEYDGGAHTAAGRSARSTRTGHCLRW